MRSAERPVVRVLLASFIATHFVELVRLARVLRDGPEFQPLLAFAGNYTERAAQARSSRGEGLAVIGAVGGPGTAPASSANPGNLRRSGVRDAFNRSFASIPLWIRRERAAVSEAGRMLDEASPDVLVLAEDNAAYPTANWIAAAHERGIPVVLIPYTVAGATEFAEALLRNRRHWLAQPANFVAGAMFPRWIYEHRGRKLVRLPAARLVAKELAGLAPPRPWALHSGSADAIAVESGRMMAHYESEGLPSGKLRLTGSLADDALAGSLANRARLRAELQERLSLPTGQPILLCALPPDQFVYCSEQTAFASYHSLVESWVQALLRVRGWSVVIRPHPREHGSISVPGGNDVRVSHEDTASLVPLCDVYVASVSATIRWAIGCGVPVLNYDAYRLRYTDYDEVAGVLKMEDQRDFEEALSRVTRDSAFRAELGRAQQSVASDWALLDGQSGARVLALLGELARKRPVGAAA